MRLESKKAIVTGASEGIGKAIAERLLLEGAYVLLTGRDVQKLGTAVKQMHESWPDARNRALAFAADACDVAQAEATVTKALEEFGQVDILVNNVGRLVRKSIAESTVEDFDRDFSANVRSAVAHAHAVVDPMKRMRRGVIINISSLAGTLPVPKCSFYSPAKAALLMYTRTLAAELASYGIRVNCISPGAVDTRIHEKMLGIDASAYKEGLRQLVPLQRLGKPEDVASAVAYLASDECSWITGINLVLDGGRTVCSGIAKAFSSAMT